MEHFEYVRDLVGIDHVTFGPDTLYGDHAALQEYFGHDLSDFPDFVEEIEAVRGMDNPTESWHNIIRWLVREGYSDSEIEKVLGVNTLRVLQEIW
jgi:membrane dipeptidase